MLQPPAQPLVVDGAGMPGNGVTERSVSYGIVRLNAPVTAAFNMKQLWMHFLTAPVRNNCQKHSQSPFSAF